jgi:endonuclease-3
VPAALPGRLHRHGCAVRALDRSGCPGGETARQIAEKKDPRSNTKDDFAGSQGGHRRRIEAQGGPLNPHKRREIFERFRAANPQPRTELVYRTPYELLVSVVLSAQATDKSVNLATAKLFPVANTPGQIVRLGEEKLIGYIKTIGLFRTKAKNVVQLSRLLLEKFHGEIPQNREDLETLPGVGRKTANVVLNTAFGQPTMAVDTHIFRVANRTGIAPGKSPLEVEQKLLKFTPPEFLLNAHHWLILHGRYVCLARKPGCPECLIRDLCDFRPKTK